MSNKPALLKRYKESLLDAERAFENEQDIDAAYMRHLDVALQALSELRPQIKGWYWSWYHFAARIPLLWAF